MLVEKDIKDIYVWVDEYYWWESIKPFSWTILFSSYITNINTGNNCIWVDESKIYCGDYWKGSTTTTKTYEQLTANPPQSSYSSAYTQSYVLDTQIIDWTYVYVYNYAWNSQYVYWLKLSTEWDRSSSTTSLWQTPTFSGGSWSLRPHIFRVSMDWKYCVFGTISDISNSIGTPYLYKLTTPYDLSTMTRIWSTGITVFWTQFSGAIEFLYDWTNYYLVYIEKENNAYYFTYKQAKLNVSKGTCSDIIAISNRLGQYSSGEFKHNRLSIWPRYKDWKFVPALFRSDGSTTLYYVDCITS